MLDDNEAHAAQGGRVITVIGYSFGFSYRYDSDGGFTRNDGLYVPVGEPITLHMITPLYTPGTKNLEVIHGFWVPRVGRQAGRHAGRDRQDGRHDLRQAHARRAPTRCSAPSCAARATARCSSRTSTCSRSRDFDEVARRAPRPRPPRQAAGLQANPGLAVFNDSGCGGCHTLAAAKSSGQDRPAAG